MKLEKRLADMILKCFGSLLAVVIMGILYTSSPNEGNNYPRQYAVRQDIWRYLIVQAPTRVYSVMNGTVKSCETRINWRGVNISGHLALVVSKNFVYGRNKKCRYQYL